MTGAVLGASWIAGGARDGSFAIVTMSDPPLTPISTIMARRLAHAIRSTLAGAHGALAEIGQSPSVETNPSLAQYVAIARRSMSQLVDLADHLGWAGRVERVTEESLQVVEWPAMIRRCVEARCVERVTRGRKPVDVIIADEVGEGKARVDASERALAELLDNAVRFARTRIRVTADVDGQELRIRVIDDGPGLPDGGVDPFAPPQKAEGSRVGVGLWLVERLAAALHGSVAVERTDEKGTVMCLRLPLQGPA